MYANIVYNNRDKIEEISIIIMLMLGLFLSIFISTLWFAHVETLPFFDP